MTISHAKQPQAPSSANRPSGLVPGLPLSKKRLLIAALLAMNIILRLPLWLTYEPVTAPDSASYVQMAYQIANLDFSQYLGYRPPLYPLFLLLCGVNFSVVWALQSALGIVLSLMLFGVAFKETQKPGMSFIIGLAPSACINLLAFEANVLTETLTAFLLFGSLYFLQRAIQEEESSIVPYACSGILVALAALTRPFLAFLGPLYGGFFLYKWVADRQPFRKSLRLGVAFVLPVFVLLFAWSYFNKHKLDYFGLTTLLGYNLGNKSQAFIEYAPDEDAAIRDAYLKLRDWEQKRRKVIDETGVDSMGFFDPFRQMRRTTGYSHVELSRALTKASLRLFKEHPRLYVESVFWAWCEFWKVAIHWDPNKIENRPLRNLMKVTWVLERYLLILVEFVFLCISLLYGYRMLRNGRRVRMFPLAVITVVLTACLLQAMVESGSSRYAAPFFPLILFIVLREAVSRRDGSSGRAARPASDFLPAATP